MHLSLSLDVAEFHAVRICRSTGLILPELGSILHDIPDDSLYDYKSRVLGAAWHPYITFWMWDRVSTNVPPQVRNAFVRSYVASYCWLYRLVPSHLCSLIPQMKRASSTDHTDPSINQLVEALGELWAIERWGPVE